MAAEVKKGIELEIAHVLFIDIVGYSKVLIIEQRALLDKLNHGAVLHDSLSDILALIRRVGSAKS